MSQAIKDVSKESSLPSRSTVVDKLTLDSLVRWIKLVSPPKRRIMLFLRNTIYFQTTPLNNFNISDESLDFLLLSFRPPPSREHPKRVYVVTASS